MRENVVSKVCNFSRFVADRAYHTCAALEREGVATLAVLVTFAPKVTPAQRKKRVCAYTRARILRLVSLAQNDRIPLCVFITGRRGRRPLRDIYKQLFALFQFTER